MVNSIGSSTLILNLTDHFEHFKFMVFNATFNNISVILWQSVLLVEESGKNHRQIISHKVESSTPSHEWNWNSQL